MKKRQPYRYNFGGTIVKSWRKLYKAKDVVICHKKGDFLVPVGPSLQMEIAQAQLKAKMAG